MRNHTRRFEKWWCDKYRRPPNDPLLLELTEEELLIQFFQDLIEQDVSEALPPGPGPVRIRTADPVTNKWDEDLDEKGEFDPTDGMSEEDAAALRAFVAKTKNALSADLPSLATVIPEGALPAAPAQESPACPQIYADSDADLADIDEDYTR